MLRWAVQKPDEVIAWLDPSFLVDPVRSLALQYLLDGGDVHAALELAGEDEGVARVLYEAATSEPLGEADDVVARVVSNTALRVKAELLRRAAESGDASTAATASDLTLWAERLVEPEARRSALNMLVPWLSSWATQWNTKP